MHEKIRSSIHGFIIGDILGVPVEFYERTYLKENPITDMINNKYRSTTIGFYSDDSAMTLCTMKGIIDNPNDMIIADGIITKPYKNCFEEEDNYFEECPVLDETDKYTDTNISKFLEVLADMPTLDIETKRSVRRKIISNKVLMK